MSCNDFAVAAMSALSDSDTRICQFLPLCEDGFKAFGREIAKAHCDLCEAVLRTRQVDGVWIFDIKEDDERGQGLKNEASVRLVPVSFSTASVGLLDYVRQTKATGALRLFPQLTRGGNGYGDSVGSPSHDTWGRWGLTIQERSYTPYGTL